MGGCASRPKDLDLETKAAPAPQEPVVENVEAKPAAETVTQEKTEEVASEPLIDLSPAAEEETKEAAAAPVETESKPTDQSEAKVVVEGNKEVVA